MRLIQPVLVAVLLAGCATQPAHTSLYDDLGRQEGISSLVESLLDEIADDPRIAPQFAEVDLINLHGRLVEQICAEAGGPCTYGGKSMAEAHAHLAIRESDFNALVEALIAAMEAEGIARPAQNRLLRRLAPMQGDIVNH